MYSAFYRYLNIHPISKHDALPTESIESIIKSYGIFKEREKGNFSNNDSIFTPVDLQLMKVSNYHSWSNNNFDSKETNYIAITISREEIPEECILKYIVDMARRLQWVLIEEDDKDGIVLFSPMT